MSLIRLFQEKKYLLRIFLWIAGIILLIVVSFSALVYVNVEKKVFKSEYENSQKVLSQMKYNIDYLDTMIRNITLSTYGSNDVKALMYLNDEETYEHLNVINKLNATIVANNPFIQSIYIYNNHKKLYYSTYGDLYHKDAELDKVLQSYTTIPVLRAIVRRSAESDDLGAGGTAANTVLSYVMYETTDRDNRMDGAIILNIKLDWLVDNIRAINRIEAGARSELYILDSGNGLIETDPGNPVQGSTFANTIRQAYVDQASGTEAQSAQPSGFFDQSIGGEKYIISYIRLEKTGWTLLDAKPYKEAYANLKQLLDTILLITMAIFAGALLLTLSVSRGIYKPVRRLMEQTSLGGSVTPGAKDEFSYLTEVYRKSREQLYEYHLEKNNNTGIMKLYFLKRLLVDSFSMSGTAFGEALHSLHPALSQEKPFVICVLRIDNYKLFMTKSLVERELLRFAIANITTEVISRSFAHQTVDMKDDSFTILLNIDSALQAASVEELLVEAQRYIKEHYKISFSVAISEPIEHYQAIAAAYSHTFTNSSYRYVQGHMAVITQAEIDEQASSIAMEQVMELTGKFIEVVKKGDPMRTEEKFRELFRNIRKLEYSDIMLASMQVVHHLKKAVYEMNRTLKEPIHIHAKLLNRELYEEETAEQFEEQLLEAVLTMTSERKSAAEEGNQVAADTIKAFIDSNYFDSSLSATDISGMMRLSAYKLSKISKEHFGMSIPEYINQVRLAKAVEWMENSKLSIQEIMRRVGIENESYFYKLFKAKFGLTPREYIAGRGKG
ncbi:AraC family transcriptional regulator [Paenibacillus sp. BC26]|uniref:AraC family transcriptional regulator n=1 Tax=Paenibacillus sp. BC26 TaxID=1881032 RepID=UPI0008E8A117|nr:AraC family transcriptional regulator [Paenibacillus sp. BC26]SFS50890.1 Cache domain-containing protein [Paenibacillus sp. BC26]